MTILKLSLFKPPSVAAIL